MPMFKIFEVVDCSFTFECPRKWEDLKTSPFANIRHCEVCNKPVFKCQNQKQADWAIANKQCAAVVTDVMVQTMGDIGPPKANRRQQIDSIE